MKQKQTGMAIVILALAALTFWASSSPKMVAKSTPVYTWTPPTEEKVPNKFTIAIVNPFYADNTMAQYDPFLTFSRSLAADIEEALTARGYSIRGPFKSRDEMVYNDKETSDLAITFEIAPEFRMVQGQFTTDAITRCPDGSRPIYLSKGIISIAGKINLTAMEPLSGEKLWVKSVEIPLSQTEEISSERGWCVARSVVPFIIYDGVIFNSVVALMEDGYGNIIDKIWNHIHPSEFERLRTTIQDLKKERE